MNEQVSIKPHVHRSADLNVSLSSLSSFDCLSIAFSRHRRMMPLPPTRQIPRAYLRATLTRAYTPGSNSSSSGQRPATVHPHAPHGVDKPIAKPQVPPTATSTPSPHVHASPFASPTELASTTPPPPRHEAHEGASAFSVGAGGGPGGTPTGRASTGNPLLDTALTTIVGLGTGASGNPFHLFAALYWGRGLTGADRLVFFQCSSGASGTSNGTSRTSSTRSSSRSRRGTIPRWSSRTRRKRATHSIRTVRLRQVILH